jgi:hypothetical protein
MRFSFTRAATQARETPLDRAEDDAMRAALGGIAAPAAVPAGSPVLPP